MISDQNNNAFLTPLATCIGCGVFTIMLGVVDWASGYELQFFVFYFIPVAVAAWACGLWQGMAVACLSALVWFFADWCSEHPYARVLYVFWNTTIRLVSFLILGYTVSRIKALLVEERRISADLQKTLSEVKHLKGLLPICAGCKKIRNDTGYWQQIEEYIEKHSDAQFTHGLCQECAAKTLKEAGISDDLIQQTIREVSNDEPRKGAVLLC